eukprot:COSAG04_NODE_436_length_14464_cov_7.310825_8_plen_990_part_00
MDGSAMELFEVRCPTADGAPLPDALGLECTKTNGTVVVSSVVPGSYAAQEWALSAGMKIRACQRRDTSEMDLEELQLIMRTERPLVLSVAAAPDAAPRPLAAWLVDLLDKSRLSQYTAAFRAARVEEIEDVREMGRATTSSMGLSSTEAKRLQRYANADGSGEAPLRVPPEAFAPLAEPPPASAPPLVAPLAEPPPASAPPLVTVAACDWPEEGFVGKSEVPAAATAPGDEDVVLAVAAVPVALQQEGDAAADAAERGEIPQAPELPELQATAATPEPAEERARSLTQTLSAKASAGAKALKTKGQELRASTQRARVPSHVPLLPADLEAAAPPMPASSPSSREQQAESAPNSGNIAPIWCFIMALLLATAGVFAMVMLLLTGGSSQTSPTLLMAGQERNVGVRISGGGSRGVLEMSIDGGRWDAVCDDSFGSAEAGVFCRELGFASGSTYDTTHGDSAFAADDINCPAGATSISECSSPTSPYTDNCGDSETVGIDCSAPCGRGQFRTSSGCSSGCSSGTYDRCTCTSCSSCPSGKTSAAGSDSQSDCTSCSSGQYAASGSSSCSTCAAGKYQPSAGQSSCITCPAGKQDTSSRTSCSTCSAGTYDRSDRTSCTSCPSGKTSAAGSDSSTDCYTVCGQGTYRSGGSCSSCLAGMYQSSASHTSGFCSSCAAGKHQPSAGQSSCITCAAGKQDTSSRTSCSTCSAGTFDRSDRTSCTSCPSGKTSAAGSDSSSDCTSCSSGQYAASGSSSCSTCAAGKYQPSTGQSSCITCAAGTQDTSSRTSCSTCPAGTYDRSDRTSCTDCPSGQTSAAGSDSSSDCYDPCAAGRGDHYIEHGGYTWRTLDGADPQGGGWDAPNGGCQCTGEQTHANSYGCGDGPNYLPLPAGWVLAPGPNIDWDSDCHPKRGNSWDHDYLAATSNWPECSDATSIAVVAAHGWSTTRVVLADGSAWWSRNICCGLAGDSCGSDRLATSGATYTVTECNRRVLARCG